MLITLSYRMRVLLDMRTVLDKLQNARYGHRVREVKKIISSDLDGASMLPPTFSAPPVPIPPSRLIRFWTESLMSPDLLPNPRMYSRCLPTTSRFP